jgi:Rrf2 family cysteine metabolism transcriptional repressor
MALFSSKTDYALRALLDLAAQPPGRTAQSREVAARQDIPESYLNQLLVLLRRAGLVRSVRGAGGGYVLSREPHQLNLADIITALNGPDYLGEVPGSGSTAPSAYVIRGLHGKLTGVVREELKQLTLADLVTDLHRLDEAQSLMLGL